MRFVHRIGWITCLWLFLVGLLFPASALTIDYAGRTVTDVVGSLKLEGHSIVYSSDLVRSGDHFYTEPPAGEEPARLQLALQQVRLDLKRMPIGRSWMIVRTASRPTRAPAQPETGRTASRKLRPAVEEVVVTSSRYVLVGDGDPDRHTLTGTEITNLPELGEDALRVVSQLPGTASIGVSARPYIRGGAQDETLVMFNEVELLESFHLRDFQSLFSTLQPSVIKKIDVYTGGFPARFGDRMSGVLDITPADEYPELGGEFLFSALTTALTGYGEHDAGHWVVSARKGNLDWLTKIVNSDVGRPAYADVFAQRRQQLSDTSDLDAGVLAYWDDVEIRDFETNPDTLQGDGEIAQSQDSNAYGWLKLHTTFSDAIHGTTTFTVAKIHQQRSGISIDSAADEATGTVDDDRHFSTLSLGTSLVQTVSDTVSLDYGARIHYQKGHYVYLAIAEAGDLAELLGNDEDIDRRFDLRRNGTSGNGWLSARFRPSLSWDIEAGVRLDYYALPQPKRWRFGPRLQVRYTPTDNSAFALSGGRYYQGQSITELAIADGVTHFDAPEYADHLIAGVYWAPGPAGLGVRFEAYYKLFGEPAPRFENLFNPLVMLPEIKPDRIRIEPTSGVARGFEWSINYVPDDTLNTWFSYSLAYVADRVNGQKRPRAWDQRHSIHTGIAWTPADWSFSLAANWQSGWQNTSLPAFLAELEPIELRHNSSNLPDYLSVDARISRSWHFGEHTLSAWLEVINLTGRKNVGGIEHELEELESGGFQRVSDDRTLLPLVPSMGFSWKFQ